MKHAMTVGAGKADGTGLGEHPPGPGRPTRPAEVCNAFTSEVWRRGQPRDIIGRMALFEIVDKRLARREPLGFAALGMREREDIQALLFGHIGALGDDLKVIAQEYGNWEDARRRLDVLALDREGHLVVIELKRTASAAHAELQALRYAAMIATLTFDEVAATYAATLKTDAGAALVPPGTDPRADLLDFLGALDDEEAPTLSSEVRIVLASADFSRELTTTVLWLNQFEGMDIRCVRLRPFDIDGRTLLDVEQVIPLPEAADYQVRVNRKSAQRERATTDRRDFTRYIVEVNGETIGEFNKRNTMRAVIEQLVGSGIPPERVAENLPDWALRPLEGAPQSREEMAEAVHATTGTRPDRYFLNHPLRAKGRTWAISLAWGGKLERTLDDLLEAFPEQRVTYYRA
jgi:hypothetical protein